MVAICINRIKQTLPKMKNLTVFFICVFVLLPASVSACIISTKGQPIQGGLMLFKTAGATDIQLDGVLININSENGFVIGFHRDDTEVQILSGVCPDGVSFIIKLKPKQRIYDIQKIYGLPSNMVSPPANTLNRIKMDAQIVKQARAIKGNSVNYFTDGFNWPVKGTITGVYGSQRILNGAPRQPHYGIDIAAPLGTPIHASASGEISMVKNLYFTGWTIIISHGDYISSTYSHLQDVFVDLGEQVTQDQIIGRVGSTGRSTGAHLDWRINWLDKRLDPKLVADMR